MTAKEGALMRALKSIPSVGNIIAAQGAVIALRRLGREPEQWLLETAAWPEEKAWDYEPPEHPILDGD